MLAMAAPAAVSGFTRAQIVIVAELFSGSVANATFTALPVFEQTPPEFAAHDTSVSEDGSVSIDEDVRRRVRAGVGDADRVGDLLPRFHGGAVRCP